MLMGKREKKDERITDSAIRIRGSLYHLECQSNPDGSMVLRMVEYDFHIAKIAEKLDISVEQVKDILRQK